MKSGGSDLIEVIQIFNNENSTFERRKMGRKRRIIHRRRVCSENQHAERNQEVSELAA